MAAKEEPGPPNERTFSRLFKIASNLRFNVLCQPWYHLTDHPSPNDAFGKVITLAFGSGDTFNLKAKVAFSVSWCTKDDQLHIDRVIVIGLPNHFPYEGLVHPKKNPVYVHLRVLKDLSLGWSVFLFNTLFRVVFFSLKEKKDVLGVLCLAMNGLFGVKSVPAWTWTW